MLPERELRALGARALGFWRELDSAYDEIESALLSPDPPELDRLAARIVGLEKTLAPMVSRLQAERARAGEESAEVRALREESEHLIGRLVERHPVILAAAMAAQEAVSNRAARTRAAREGGRRYRELEVAGARFTSQRA